MLFGEDLEQRMAGSRQLLGRKRLLDHSVDLGREPGEGAVTAMGSNPSSRTAAEAGPATDESPAIAAASPGSPPAARTATPRTSAWCGRSPNVPPSP